MTQTLAVQPDTPRRLYLQPGYFHVAIEPTSIVTILGSCVSVCLWDGRRHVGAANHFLLARTPLGERRSFRYGDHAVPELVSAILAAGSRRTDLTAQIYGGACVIEAFAGSARLLGEQNVEAAVRLLREEGVPVTASAAGGNRGRKIAFDTWSGATAVREI